MMTEAHEGRWRFLAPWLESLTLSVEEYSEFESATLHSEFKTIHVGFDAIPYTDIAQLTKICEAVELLGLALRLDRQAWRQLTCPLTLDENNVFEYEEFGPGALSPHLTLHADAVDVVETADDVRKFTTFFITPEDATRSPRYKGTLRRIKAMDTSGVLDSYKTPIVINMAPDVA
ncbi:hypothetical protein Poli38472_011186 [Pythium oligandrum]|uniref:Uncharacterized protein n=1 Tax=Pythium oligandrum TaxID=41045 RepID=A0A8K1CPS0_PYTOL|nr:hypothetical protein Poli38472_011186 [Pythium oligandrum]|eukprot:TMW67566.1 hypothetical protein Poli38472_011186 [Pythium oligandrum]